MIKWLIILILFVYAVDAQVKRHTLHYRQDKTILLKPDSLNLQNPQILKIITKIENGIRRGTIEMFAHEFSTMVSISIGSVENNSLSMNQTISILFEYFSERRTISFDFSLIDTKRETPYATGRYTCIHNGSKESVQIYISFTLQDSQWLIKQFNIY